MKCSSNIVAVIGTSFVLLLVYSFIVTDQPIYIANYVKVAENIDKKEPTPIKVLQTDVVEDEQGSVTAIVNDSLADFFQVSNENILMELLAGSLQMKPINNRPTPHSLQIVIVTTWRSGSTFLEQLLSSHNGTLDFYEPLMQFGFKRLIEGDFDGNKASSLIHDILNCRIDNEEYLATGRRIPDMFARNKRLWNICKKGKNSQLCYDKNFLSLSCELFPWMVMKIVRGGLSLIRPILDDTKLNPQIVFLVRDPRAIFNSRKSSVKWCNKPICSDPLLLCKGMESDLDVFLKLKELFPNRLHLVRYEDISLSPFEETNKLIKDIGWDFSNEMSTFLSEHTTHDNDTPWSTSRKSAKRVTHWMEVSSFTDVKKVQEDCSSIMERLGYLPVSSLGNLSLRNILRPLTFSDIH